jgi:hypothetical protein
MTAALYLACKQPPAKTPEELFWEAHNRVIEARDQAGWRGYPCDPCDPCTREPLDRMFRALSAAGAELLQRDMDDWRRANGLS